MDTGFDTAPAGIASAHLHQVGTGAERPPVPSQYHHGHIGIGGSINECLSGSIVQGLAEGVQRIGPVQGQQPYPAVVFDLQHRTSSYSGFQRGSRPSRKA